MKVELVKEYRFEAAHKLPNVPEGHKCQRLHGHSFKFEIHVVGPVDARSGWFVGYVKDDAYIEYRYATNAAHGHGLVYNIGDPPVEGFTSFLWTVLLIVPAWLHVPLLAFGKIVGAAAMLGCIAMVAALVRARGG